MAKFPFQLLIKRRSDKRQAETLICTAPLRIIPGGREVYDALWNGQSVIVKVFSRKIGAKHHFRREWRGLNLLRKRRLNSPEPLFCGRTENGQWAVVVEKIVDSATVFDVFHKTTKKAEKLDLMVLLCKELARQHNIGVLQRDLHLRNFLLRDNKIFTLDAAKVRFFSHRVKRQKSISQLALLSLDSPTVETESITKLCEEYFKARCWQFEKSDKALFEKQLTLHRKRGIKEGLRKCLRTSRRTLRLKFRNCIAVFDRCFCQQAEPLDFIKQINELMDAGKILLHLDQPHDAVRVIVQDRSAVLRIHPEPERAIGLQRPERGVLLAERANFDDPLIAE